MRVRKLPKTKSDTKKSFVYVRVTGTIKDLITQQSAREGVTPSEWVRGLIIKELKELKTPLPLFKAPRLEEESEATNET
jgi:hypothetical protein